MSQVLNQNHKHSSNNTVSLSFSHMKYIRLQSVLIATYMPNVKIVLYIVSIIIIASKE